MKLLDLPVDVINILPNYFNSIHDLYNVLQTCRTFYAAYCEFEVKLPPILAKPDGQPLFQPHPHLLLTLVARQIGDWAISSPSNRYELYKSLSRGYDGLLSLAERVTYVSLSDLRHLHEIKYSVLNRLTRLVDFEVGPAMVRNQDMDPAEYGLTICNCPDLAVMNYVVYCELFHHYIDEILASAEMTTNERESSQDGGTVTASILTSPSPNSTPRPLESNIRHRFIAHCLPDRNNHRNPSYNSLGRGGPNNNSEWQLLDYLEMSRCDAVRSRDESLRRYWNTGILQPLPNGDVVGHNGHEWDWTPSIAEKRENLFVLVAGHLGYTSLKMLLLDGLHDPALIAQLASIRANLQSIPNLSISSWEYWNHDDEADSSSDDEGEDVEWHSWMGMASDCDYGMSTNQETDEDLKKEAEKEEKRLIMAVERERRGEERQGMKA
jgi:hypothetical protein